GPAHTAIDAVLFDDRRDEPRHADAVAPHDERARLLLLVDEGRAHRLRILRAEDEHVPGLDALVALELPPGARAAVAGHDLPHAQHLAAEVARIPDVFEVKPGLVGAGHAAFDGGRVAIHEEPSGVEADRPREPGLRLR